jgi:hypothetical protein
MTLVSAPVNFLASELTIAAEYYCFAANSDVPIPRWEFRCGKIVFLRTPISTSAGSSIAVNLIFAFEGVMVDFWGRPSYAKGTFFPRH